MIPPRTTNRIRKLRNLHYGPGDIALVTGLTVREVNRAIADMESPKPKPKRQPTTPAAPGEAELRKHAAFLISLGYDPDVVRANFG